MTIAEAQAEPAEEPPVPLAGGGEKGLTYAQWPHARDEKNFLMDKSITFR